MRSILFNAERLGSERVREKVGEFEGFLVTVLNAPQMDKDLLLSFRDRYIIFGELFDELTAEATGGSKHFTAKFGDDVDLFELPAAIFNHFDDGSAFCTNASNGPFDVTAGVVVSIRTEDAGTDCKLRVGAVGSAAGFQR